MKGLICISALILFGSFPILLPFKAKAQNPVAFECCGLKKTIPEFLENPVSAAIADNILISNQILKPIMNTMSDFEIRNFHFLGDKIYQADIITCLRDTLYAREYVVYINSGQSLSAVQGKVVRLPNNQQFPKKYCFLSQSDSTELTIASPVFFGGWIDSLVRHHFFSLEGDPVLARERIKMNPDFSFTSRSPAAQYIEIKVGNHYRSIFYDTDLQYVTVSVYDSKLNETKYISPVNSESYTQLLACLQKISLNYLESQNKLN